MRLFQTKTSTVAALLLVLAACRRESDPAAKNEPDLQGKPIAKRKNPPPKLFQGTVPPSGAAELKIMAAMS